MRISDWSSDVCSSDLSLWDYSLRARYEFSPDAYVYLSYATGTKGGGFVSNDALLLYNIQNGIATFQYDSERARSWEVGGKFRFLDGKGNLNVALFRTNFSNLQVSEYNGTAFVTGNAASAIDRTSTRLNSSHSCASRIPSSA